MPTVYIETYGCQMNVADTELMLGHLRDHGWDRTDAPERADAILLNTAIREHAEARVLGRLGELARHKRRRPDVRSASPAAWRSTSARSCASVRPRSTCSSVRTLSPLPELLRADGGDPHVELRLDPARPTPTCRLLRAAAGSAPG
jgi:hypothetical protein